MTKAIFSVLLIVLSNSAFAEIYKWVDENGKTQFGDKPPLSSHFDTLDNTPPTPRAQSNTSPDAAAIKERTQKLIESFEADRQTKQPQKNKASTPQQKECQRAKEYERKIHRGGLYTLDKDGNRVYLPEADRPKEIARIQQLIKQHCQ